MCRNASALPSRDSLRQVEADGYWVVDVSKFTFGDEVRVRDSAPPSMRPGRLGAIVSIQDHKDPCSYTVEFGDGSDCEISEDLIELAPD